MRLSEALQDKAWRLVSERLGLECRNQRREELERTLTRVVCQDAGQPPELGLARLMRLPDTSPEWASIISVLTVGETYFFRDPLCLDALRSDVLPRLISARRTISSRHLRIWSAGCSTGEEPYTVAMLLDRLLPDRAEWNLSIVATDLNQQALTRAQRGRYSTWALRETPDWAKRKYFHQTGTDEHEMDAAIREMVTFRLFNLMGHESFSVESRISDVDLLLCRNVLMYFTPEAQRTTAARLRSALALEGWLVVNPAEASVHLFRPLTPVNHPGVILFHNAATDKDKLVAFATASDYPSEPPSPYGYATETKIQSSQMRPTQEMDIDGYLPLCGTALLDQVEILADQGRLAEARQLCERAVGQDRLNLKGHLLLGAIYQEQGELGAAVTAFRHAVYIAPDLAVGHAMLGSLLIRQGQRLNGRKSLRTAARLLERLPQHEPIPESGGLKAVSMWEIVQMALESEG